MSRIASVLLPMPLPEAFDYAEPEGMGLQLGDQVAAPLGPRLLRGVVVGLREAAGGNRPLKPIEAVLEEPRLPVGTLEFVQWAARYAADWPGQPLAIALRGARAPKPRPVRVVEPTGAQPARLTPARARVLELATDGPLGAAELARAAGVGAGVVKALIDEGVLAVRMLEADARFVPPDPARARETMNGSQAAAAAALSGMLDEGGFNVALLDGVTGSGKTEVYLEAAAHALAADPDAQVLILLPEIALTQAVIGRVAARFGAQPGEWHSDIPPPRRRRVWEAVAHGRCRIVVGARSALFLPFARLKLIVVDEEHDASFKQEDGFIYHARDLAVARGKIEDAPVILASATPSLESLRNAEQGRYRWLRLAARHGAARMPDIRRSSAPWARPLRGASRPCCSSIAEAMPRWCCARPAASA
jgi:primosomal protein N' (replication factor Y)